MIEVEVKAQINNVDKIKEKLHTIGAKKYKTEFQKDTYFNSPIVDFKQTDEALRIRKTKSDGLTQTMITYKGPKINTQSKTRKEIEMKIEDSAKAKQILENIGFIQVRDVCKNREYFKYQNFEISIDKVEGLPPYIEIEITLPDNQKYLQSQDKIFDLFKKIGITEGFETKSYLELLEEK